MMESLDCAARQHHWSDCGLALFSALEQLERDRALEFASKLVFDFSQTVISGEGRCQEFLERARDTLERAPALASPDFGVALTSAVKDSIAAVAMAARAEGRTARMSTPQRGAVLTLGYATAVELRSVDPTDGTEEKERAWLEVDFRLRELPELEASVGRGVYRPGSSFEFAVRAADAGII